MPERAAQKRKEPDDYYHQTRRPLNNLVLVLALLAFFHAGAMIYSTDFSLMAPQYLQGIFVMLGAPAAFVPAIPIIVVMVAQHILHRDKWKIQPQAIAGMIGESILWTIPLVALSYVTGRITASSAAPNHELFQKVLMAAGAGVYEEFLFRMMLISLLLLILVDLCGLKKDAMTVFAVLVAAGIFGMAHFKLLNGAYDFRWRHFIFLTIAGVLWGAIFLFRGFAVAVGSHFVWDIFALTAYVDLSRASS